MIVKLLLLFEVLFCTVVTMVPDLGRRLLHFDFFFFFDGGGGSLGVATPRRGAGDLGFGASSGLSFEFGS